MPLRTIEELGQALEGVGKGLASLVDVFQKLAIAGTRGFDVVVARRMSARLRDFSARGTQLAVSQKLILDEIADYLEDPSSDNWTEVTEQLNNTLATVVRLLSDLKQERSDFVAEPSYELLLTSLHSRAVLITGLVAMPAPQGADELRSLESIREKYQVLIGQLSEAKQALNTYIRQEDSD